MKLLWNKNAQVTSFKFDAWNHLDLAGNDGGPMSFRRLLAVASAAVLCEAKRRRRRDDDDGELDEDDEQRLMMVKGGRYWNGWNDVEGRKEIGEALEGREPRGRKKKIGENCNSTPKLYLTFD